MTARPDSPEFARLLALSARVGADPALVQGPGGNTSMKVDRVLWIKASGTWLRDAESRDIMVPVDLDPLLAAVRSDDPRAEKAHDFVVGGASGGLRPSIETTVHALLPHRIVVHVHCVETIAQAVAADPLAGLSARLKGHAFAFVPYVRPGLPLARGIAAAWSPGTDVLILGNHGLVVGGATVEEAERRLNAVSRALATAPRARPPADLDALAASARGTPYRLPSDPVAHETATDADSLAVATGGSLYPDHVIFLGPGLTALDDVPGPEGPVIVALLGRGILLRRDAMPGADELARCLADVTARLTPGHALSRLTAEQEAELLGWDAEQYRQALAREAAGLA